MSRRKQPLYSLKVPATTANLGSGFDTLGMALSLCNIFDITSLLPDGEFISKVTGEGSRELNDTGGNMLISSYRRACTEWGFPARGFTLESSNVIPVRRGLGSSSTAVVAGVTLANILAGKKISREEQLRMMVKIEGHPDNVIPCALGGMAVSSWDGEHLRYVKLPGLPKEIFVIATVPNCEVSTEKAREALPKTISYSDAVFNVGRAALLCAAWSNRQWDLLGFAMQDKLHQQYRAKLFPGGTEILNELSARPDCLSVAISGSGATMLALTRESPAPLATAMCEIFSRNDVSSYFFVLHCADGIEVTERDDVRMGVEYWDPTF